MHLQYARNTVSCSQPRTCTVTAHHCTSTPAAGATRIACRVSKTSSQTPTVVTAAAEQRHRPCQLGRHAGSVGCKRGVATCVSRVGADVCTTAQQTSLGDPLLRPQHFYAGGSQFCVRQYAASDHNDVLLLQAGSFYEAAPLGILDSLSYSLFRAEVLDGLKQKVKGLSPDSFAMLVVQREPALEDSSSGSSSSSSSTSSNGSDPSLRQAHEAWLPHSSSSGGSSSSDSDTEPSGSSSSTLADPSGSPQAGSVVGVIEVAILATSEVTRHLPGDTSSYVYISSMAVLPTLRRKGIARAMLAAAEQQARLWQVPFLALHVYVNNPTACRLYESCGFQVVHTDPGWKAVFGGKVRLLMVKPL